MLSTRALGLAPALRQAAFSPARNHVLRTVIRSSIIKRSVQTQSLKPEDGTTILNTQRLQRPSSPHFTIYEPQLTWIGSIFNRVTGLLYAGKFILALPFTFHSWNGIRHLLWDSGKFLGATAISTIVLMFQ
ncbi:succinate dehydrogenase cytochrome b560 subunit [Lentinula edodes]|uniref:Succinate dehydrogenase cytochrome b560 subunit n=1 Tax=Lentinula edodes TaxID=5353 RepID=A0A1Q3ETA5_LENED|nr:succinate dehydrogenase cytochrome b560 subunit [Lentinula edodes]